MPVKDLPGYYPTILDGGLGVMPPSLAGLFCIIGTSESGSTDVRFAVSPDDVVEEYGLGSLTTHAYDAFTAGAAQIGIARAVSDQPVATPITTPVHKIYGSGTGGSAVVAVGCSSPHTAPSSSGRLRLAIIKSGSLDTATYKVSYNDGITWGSETKFVVTNQAERKSKVEIPNGTYIEFEEDSGTPANTFAAGDEYWWWTYEPRASRDSIIAACEKATAWKDPNTGQGFEYIYVVVQSSQTWGTRDKTNILADWTAYISRASNLWNEEQRPVFFICNAPPMKPMTDADVGPTVASESIDEWIDLLNQCSAEKRDPRLCVNAGYSSLLDWRGNLEVRAAGGSAAGLVSAAKLHHSIGWVRYMRIPNSIAVYPYQPLRKLYGTTGDNPREQIGTGNGTQTKFSGVLAHQHVQPWSVKIFDADSGETFTDKGDGTLVSDATPTPGAGTIDYETGEYSLEFKTAPGAAEAVYAEYTYRTDYEMNKAKLALLNDARFLTLRHWIGYGIRFTDDWMMAEATSDYFCLRNRRIIDEAVRMIGIANVPYINSPGISERDMAAYKADLSRPLEAMKLTEEDTDKPIMAYKLTLTPDANIWSNGIVHCKVEIVPTPTKKKLEATFQLKTKVEE